MAVNINLLEVTNMTVLGTFPIWSVVDVQRVVVVTHPSAVRASISILSYEKAVLTLFERATCD